VSPNFDASAGDALEASELEESAREAFSDSRPALALSLIERSLELDPSSFDAWSFKAKILVGMERGEDALAAVDKALEIVPDDYDALAEKSGILSMFADDLPGGLRYAQQAYERMSATVPPEQRSDINGDQWWAVENVYDNLYYALYRLNRLDEAAKIRAEAMSFGHEFAEGIDDDTSPPPFAGDEPILGA
jgi:tetratricopeptide (TPR) repeat protein